MKKIFLFAAICTLMLTGCNGVFTNDDEDSTDKEQNGSDGGKDDPGSVKKVTFKTVDLSGTKTLAIAGSVAHTETKASVSTRGILYKVGDDGTTVEVEYTLDVSGEGPAIDSIKANMRLSLEYVYSFENWLWLVNCGLDYDGLESIEDNDLKSIVEELIAKAGTERQYLVRRADGALFQWEGVSCPIDYINSKLGRNKYNKDGGITRGQQDTDDCVLQDGNVIYTSGRTNNWYKSMIYGIYDHGDVLDVKQLLNNNVFTYDQPEILSGGALKFHCGYKREGQPDVDGGDQVLFPGRGQALIPIKDCYPDWTEVQTSVFSSGDRSYSMISGIGFTLQELEGPKYKYSLYLNRTKESYELKKRYPDDGYDSNGPYVCLATIPNNETVSLMTPSGGRLRLSELKEYTYNETCYPIVYYAASAGNSVPEPEEGTPARVRIQVPAGTYFVIAGNVEQGGIGLVFVPFGSLQNPTSLDLFLNVQNFQIYVRDFLGTVHQASLHEILMDYDACTVSLGESMWDWMDWNETYSLLSVEPENDLISWKVVSQDYSGGTDEYLYTGNLSTKEIIATDHTYVPPLPESLKGWDYRDDYTGVGYWLRDNNSFYVQDWNNKTAEIVTIDWSTLGEYSASIVPGSRSYPVFDSGAMAYTCTALLIEGDLLSIYVDVEGEYRGQARVILATASTGAGSVVSQFLRLN